MFEIDYYNFECRKKLLAFCFGWKDLFTVYYLIPKSFMYFLFVRSYLYYI